MASLKDDPIVRVKDVPALLGIGKRTLHDWRKRGVLPPPLELGPRVRGYRESTLREFIESRARGAA